MTRIRLAAALLAVGTMALIGTLAATAGGPGQKTYRVTLINLTGGQPFSPPVVATHDKRFHLFDVGRRASDEIAAIAQDGDELPAIQLLQSSRATTDVVDVGRPLTPLDTVVGSFTSSATIAIKASPGDRLSLATMLICTNDGFTGLDAVRLPNHRTQAYILNGYDAGREENTERSADLVDPCSGLNPGHELTGDPNGNEDAAVATTPPERITHHPGIRANGDLSADFHGWDDPVAVAVVTRIDD